MSANMMVVRIGQYLAAFVSITVAGRGNVAAMMNVQHTISDTVLPQVDDNRNAVGHTGMDDPEIGDEGDLFDHTIHRSYLTLPVANNKQCVLYRNLLRLMQLHHLVE